MIAAELLAKAERWALELPAGGEAAFAVREEIWRTLSAESPPALVRLELLCAERVWPIWAAAFPSSPMPLETARQATARRIEGDRAWRRLARLRLLLDDSFQLGSSVLPAIYAGFACWSAAGTALHGIEPLGLEPEVGPEDWSAAFFASLAASGGAIWDGEGDPLARAEYWRWYLLEALPQACSDQLNPGRSHWWSRFLR